MQKFAKFALSIALFVVSIPSWSVQAEEVQSSPNYSQYIKEAIEQEVLLDKGAPFAVQGLSSLDNQKFSIAIDDITESSTISKSTKQKIEKLENADVVMVNVDADGNLVSATSSKEGDIKSRFEKKETTVTDATYTDSIKVPTVSGITYGAVAQNKLAISTQSIISNQGNTSGSSTGAFHRLGTPASKSTSIYNGVVADSVVLPTYNTTAAYTNYGEAAYMYTGVGDHAEVGFETAISKYTPAGWYPAFHAKTVNHNVKTGDNNGYPQPSQKEITYVDRSKKYNGGDKVNGYKVYYYTTDSSLTIREQINYSDIYVVTFNGVSSQGLAVKRVTAIAMDKSTPTTTAFHYGYTTPAVWNNMRFLTNNSAGSVYPSDVSGLQNDVWNHGGKINYTKSGTSESYVFSVN